MIERGCQTVGIDLGTTYSALAYLDRQLTPRVISDSSGQNVIPSVIYFDDAGFIVGDVALQQAKSCADRVVQFVKVHMGDSWTFNHQGQTHTPESLSAIVLKHLVNEAEPQIGPISRAVITVPAYFTERRRKATEQAGQIAGLDVTGTLNEPMAATLAYGLGSTDKIQNVVVYDLGGGTFDVTVVRITPDEICELATCGNRQLGGRDWDNAIVDMIAEEFETIHGFDPRIDVQAAQDLAIESERAKRNLSRLPKAKVSFQAQGHAHVADITKSAFEERTASLVQTTRLTTEMALEDAGFDWPDVSRVLLVGGSTQMPAIREMLKRVSGLNLDFGVHPIMAVSLGAAIYAHLLEKGEQPKTVLLSESDRDVELGERDTASVVPPPFVGKRASAADVSPDQLTDDEDFSIAITAPADGKTENRDSVSDVSESITDGHDHDFEPITEESALSLPSIQFVNAHGVGIKTRTASGWANSVLIPRNQELPARASKRFLTTSEGEGGSHINIEITQGDATDIELAEILGQGRIEGFPSTLR